MDTRLVIGLSVDSIAHEVRAALARVSGAGLDCSIECLFSVALPTSHAVVGADDEVSSTTPALAGQLFFAAGRVAEHANVPLDRVLLLSVLGEPSPSADFQIAVVAPFLVELSGITTVAGFSARDCAAGGRGYPLWPLVDWLLANDQRFSRLVVHMDGASSVTFMPAAGGPARVRAFDTGPGTWFLDALAGALSRGHPPLDGRGMLAVQGRQIKPLIRRWATHPFLRQEPPKFLKHEDFTGHFIDETVQLAVERGWSVADVLCTATHFVAACPADAVRQFLAKHHAIDQAVLVGRGTQDGFLLRLLEQQLAALGSVRFGLAKIAAEAYPTVTAAVLGILTLDGVAANLPHVTGADGPCLLGNLMPGSPANWQQCIDSMHRSAKLLALHAA